MSATEAIARQPAGTEPAARSAATRTVTRWELRKLISQKRTYLGLAIAVFFPLVFVLVEHFRGVHRHDHGSIFLSHFTDSGLATPVVTLGFESLLLMPLIAALVSGDIVAAEDGNGTLKTILTRSVDRAQLLAGKVAAAAIYAGFAIFFTALVSGLVGVAFWGFHPLITFSGSVVSAPKGLLLVIVAYGCYLIPLLAVASIGIMLSTVTRNSAAAVVGTVALPLLLLLIPVIPGLEGTAPYLLTTQYSNWHGLLETPVDWAPIIHSLWVCALYEVPTLLVAYLVFLRRDVAGG